MVEKPMIEFVRSNLTMARGNLESLLDHPTDRFDLQRIRLAVDQINFALSLLKDGSE